MWWGQFGFKFDKKRAFSTLGEAGAATGYAPVKNDLSKGEAPRHAMVRLRAAAETLRGSSGDTNSCDLFCRCRDACSSPGADRDAK